MTVATLHPQLWLGTMYFGTRIDQVASHRLLDEALDLGIDHWDTANNYAFWIEGGRAGASEWCLGQWLAARGASARDRVQLATKIGALPSRPGGDLSQVVGLAAPDVRAQLVESLHRLGTDRVDLLYAHIDDRRVPLDETLGALAALVDEGLVAQIGASNLTAERLEQAMTTSAKHHHAVLQQRFSYLIPDSQADLTPQVLLDPSVEQVALAHGVHLVGYSPLLSGAYTDPDKGWPEGYGWSPALDLLDAVAQQAGLDASQTVLAWMGQRATPVTPVIGVSTGAQLRAAHAAVHTLLDPNSLVALDRARRG